MPEQIFISYSRRDLAVVKPIKEELERNGFSCWMDLDGIESGEKNFASGIPVPNTLLRCRSLSNSMRHLVIRRAFPKMTWPL